MSVAAGTPFPSSRPPRIAVAVGLATVLLVVLVASSTLGYLALRRIPFRGALLGLPATGLVAAATWVGIRAFDRDPDGRRRHQLWAAALLATALLLWLLLLDVFLFTQEAGPAAAAVAALACVPTTGLGLWVIQRLDRQRKEPWRLVLVATAWGAIVATSLVLWAEGLWSSWSVHTLVPGPGLDASNAFSAGLFEELAKGSAVLLLYLVMRNEFHDVVDGVIYGAAVGLGFNFMESIGYMTYLDSILGPSAAAFQWYHRQVLGLFFGHATYTALIGAGIGIARQLPRRRQRVVAIACGFLGAIAAHFAWDAWLTFYPLGTGWVTLAQIHLRVLAMNGPFTGVVLLLVLMGRRIEGRNLQRQLRLEAGTGLGAVLPDEVPVLASPGLRFRARLGAGPRRYLQAGRLQRAQIDLALARWHRERGELDAPHGVEQSLRDRIEKLRGE